MSARSTRLAWIAVVAAIFIMCAIVAAGFSFDMDEFLPYHEIACQQAGQALSVYQGACNVLPTEFLGWEFQRSFNYAGAMSTWLMTPVFALWHSWWAHSLAGFAALALAGWGITKSLKVPALYSLTALAFFPLLFPTVHDTGPIRLSLVVLAWTPAALRFILSAGRPWLRAAVGAALFLGFLASTENKPFFLYLFPGIAAWTVACLYYTNGLKYLKDHWKGILAWAIGLGVACMGLLIVLRTEGMTYLEYLSEMRSTNDPIVNAGTALTFLGDWPFSAQRFVLVYPNVDAAFPKLLQSPINALPLTADRGGMIALLATTLAIALSIGLVAWAFLRSWKQRGKATALLFATAAAALIAGPWLSGGGSVHHFVYAQVAILAIIIVAGVTTTNGTLTVTAAITAVSWICLAAVMVTGRNPSVGPNVDEIMQAAFDRAGPKTIINCANWGCYHQYAFLDDKPAPIVFAETPDEQHQLQADARERGLTILQVCKDCTSEGVQEATAPTDVEELEAVSGGWRLLAVTP